MKSGSMTGCLGMDVVANRRQARSLSLIETWTTEMPETETCHSLHGYGTVH